MSSNGFTTAAKLHCLPIPSLRLRALQSGLSLGVTAAGNWMLDSRGHREAVLLLRHRSFWGSRLAGVSVRTRKGATLVVWLLARGQDSDTWRRLRVRLRYP